MNRLPFIWSENFPLLDELELGFCKLSCGLTKNCGLFCVTLWKENGLGIRVRNQMFDLEDRLEVGVLAFEVTNNINYDEIYINTERSPNNHFSVARLEIICVGNIVESGMVLTRLDGSELVVVAGSFPYSLAIQGVGDDPNYFSPEYDMSEYTRVPWSPSKAQ